MILGDSEGIGMEDGIGSKLLIGVQISRIFQKVGINIPFSFRVH
jgi:hypothetical protein